MKDPIPVFQKQLAKFIGCPFVFGGDRCCSNAEQTEVQREKDEFVAAAKAVMKELRQRRKRDKNA